MKRVVVRIDRLVLRGFDGCDRDEIAEGLREELIHQFSGSDALNRLTGQSAKPILRIGGVPIRRGSMPREVGVQLARSLGKRDHP
jgi:hypothetical protein